MSMLAERRRKTKWVINPTKKPLWTTDSNGMKFGKELMEKMGWSAGKGLGAKEQGIQEPLRVSYKNDTKGMGFKGNDDDWIEQQDEFNVLLNQLRNNDDSSVVKASEEEKNEIKSLEEKSRQSRARVHYQKFTRGKDLSRYSENDLACILGTNKIKKEKKKSEVVESEEKTDGHLEVSFGVTTINSGSIEDYFKRKRFISKVQSKSLSDVDKENEEYSCDERPSFSRMCEESLNLESKDFSKKEHKTDDGDGSELNVDSGEKYEKRKKRKKKDGQASEEEEPKSKRKKMTSDQDNPVDEELQNSLAGVAGNEIETNSLLGDEKDCDSSRKRKKEKRKSKEDEGNDESEEANMVELKKKKKKEKKEKPVENGYCDAGEVASFDCSLEAECPEREGGLVKKKKKGIHGNEVFGESEKENIEVGLGEMNDVVEGEDIMSDKRKKKKEKHKDHGGNVGVDEACGKNEELGEVSEVSPGDAVEVGSKKKKRKKEKEDDKMECCSNENRISSEVLVQGYDGERNCDSILELEQSRKKKKKKEDKIECCSNENEIPVEKCDTGSNSNGTTELEEVKKKKREKKEDKTECYSNENDIPVEKCYSGSNSNGTTKLEEVKKKKREKKKDKVECNENGLSSEIPVEKYDGGNNSNSTAELEEVKKKKKKKKKQEDKVECHSNEDGPSSHEKCDGENNTNDTVELDEVKKRKKKKEKQEGNKVECCINENGLFSEIPVEKCDTGSNPDSTTELEQVKKKKKKDKHKTKEDDSVTNNMKESHLEETCQEASETETLHKKKKKDKKEKQKSKDESSVDHHEEENKEPCPDNESTKKKKKEKKSSDGEERKKEGEEEETKGNEPKWGGGGNAEIGTTAGIDRVELISQRAAYEHVPGQHRYERVKKLIQCVNLARFRGSNLECLDGYGNRLRKCETSSS